MDTVLNWKELPDMTTNFPAVVTVVALVALVARVAVVALVPVVARVAVVTGYCSGLLKAGLYVLFVCILLDVC